MIVYRDGLGDVVALDMASGKRRRRRFDSNAEVLIAAECSPDGSRIAYLKQDFKEVNRQIVVAGQSAPAQPLSISSQAEGIAWSPDGTEIAYTEVNAKTGYRLWLLDVASGNQKQLASGDGLAGAPRWSPDGGRIAFRVQSGNRSQVTLYDVSSNSQQSLNAAGDGVTAYDPDWSADSRRLLVAGMDPKQGFQLYTLDLAGGGERKLTSSDVFKRQPRYSPDGSVIAFTGSIVVPTVSLRAMRLHSFGVFIVNSDGSDERPLTTDPRLNPGAGVDPFLDAMLLGWCLPGPWLDESWAPE